VVAELGKGGQIISERELEWNRGTIRNSVDTVFQFAQNMTYNGIYPIVTIFAITSIRIIIFLELPWSPNL